jgi:hypothetical protein
MQAPTQTQINSEITELKRLRPLIPPQTAFGDSNWDKIDAEIETLECNLSDMDINNRTDADEGDDPDAEFEWSYDVGSAARAALEWKSGEEGVEKPSDGWQCLVGVKPKFNFRGLGIKEATAMIHAAEAMEVKPSKPAAKSKRKNKKGK